jgi:hypothetical protein
MLISVEAVGLPRDLLMTLAWAVNVFVAERIIKRRGRATAPTPPTSQLPIA